MPTNHDETLQERYQREARVNERLEEAARQRAAKKPAEPAIQHLPADDTEGGEA